MRPDCLTRYREPDERSLAGRGLSPDRSAVACGHLTDDGKPEAGAGDATGRRRAVETVEDMGQVGGRYARAVIAHRKLASPQAHLYPAAGRAELGRVVQQ